MSAHTQEDLYFPPPESRGGWRYLKTDEEVSQKGGMDPKKLGLLFHAQNLVHGGDSWSAVVIRHGYIVKEFHTFNVLNHTRFDIWSGTKSFTGTAWGLLLEDSRNETLPNGTHVDLESPAYQYIAEGHPLSDPLKASILIKHLLSMTSGIAGEDAGVIGMPTSIDGGPFEHALGRCPNRYGTWVDKLAAVPGTKWSYSDAGFCHLSMIFASIAGMEMSEFLQKRVFGPVGIDNASWDVQGGSGFIGPHTNGHTGLHISARELARFGYLMLHKGTWLGKRLVPEWWTELATRSSQQLVADYGYTWWVNTAGSCWPGMPRDMFALMGYRSNKCYIIPSLDLVVARIGSGPVNWHEPDFIGGIVGSVAR